MLPTFQIRGFRCCDTEIAPDADYVTEQWTDIQLDDRAQYDELIRETPEAILSYVDEEDGDVITVGSAYELYERIEEVHPTSPVVFDLKVNDEAGLSKAHKSWKKLVAKDDSNKENEFGGHITHADRSRDLLMDLDEPASSRDSSQTLHADSLAELSNALSAAEGPSPVLTRRRSLDALDLGTAISAAERPSPSSSSGDDEDRQRQELCELIYGHPRPFPGRGPHHHRHHHGPPPPPPHGFGPRHRGPPPPPHGPPPCLRPHRECGPFRHVRGPPGFGRPFPDPHPHSRRSHPHPAIPCIPPPPPPSLLPSPPLPPEHGFFLPPPPPPPHTEAPGFRPPPPPPMPCGIPLPPQQPRNGFVPGTVGGSDHPERHRRRERMERHQELRERCERERCERRERRLENHHNLRRANTIIGTSRAATRTDTTPGDGVRAGGSRLTGSDGPPPLQDYQIQLILLEQQNKRRLMMARREQDASSTEDRTEDVREGQNSDLALQDYQAQLMLLEQQNKKRLMMARRDQDASSTEDRTKDVREGQNSDLALQDYQAQLMLLEQQNKKRLMMARRDQDTSSTEDRSEDAREEQNKSNDGNEHAQQEQGIRHPDGSTREFPTLGDLMLHVTTDNPMLLPARRSSPPPEAWSGLPPPPPPVSLLDMPPSPQLPPADLPSQPRSDSTASGERPKPEPALPEPRPLRPVRSVQRGLQQPLGRAGTVSGGERRFTWERLYGPPTSFDDILSPGIRRRETMPGGFPTHEPEREREELNEKEDDKEGRDDGEVDECVAQLVEMGFAEGVAGSDQEDNREGVERLSMVARICGGDVLAAVEMLEEERKAWENCSDRLPDNFDFDAFLYGTNGHV